MDLFPHSDYITETFSVLDRNSKTFEEDEDGYPTWTQPNNAFTQESPSQETASPLPSPQTLKTKNTFLKSNNLLKTSPKHGLSSTSGTNIHAMIQTSTSKRNGSSPRQKHTAPSFHPTYPLTMNRKSLIL